MTQARLVATSDRESAWSVNVWYSLWPLGWQILRCTRFRIVRPDNQEKSSSELVMWWFLQPSKLTEFLMSAETDTSCSLLSWMSGYLPHMNETSVLFTIDKDSAHDTWNWFLVSWIEFSQSCTWSTCSFKIDYTWLLSLHSLVNHLISHELDPFVHLFPPHIILTQSINDHPSHHTSTSSDYSIAFHDTWSPFFTRRI